MPKTQLPSFLIDLGLSLTKFRADDGYSFDLTVMAEWALKNTQLPSFLIDLGLSLTKFWAVDGHSLV